MKKVFLCLALGTMWSLSMQAGTLLPQTTPDTNFTATVDLGTGNITINLASQETLNVFDDSSTLLGQVRAGSLNPNQVITLDLPGMSELVALSFAGTLTSPGVALLGTNLFIPAVGSAITPVTQPQMLALLGDSLFGFTFETRTDTSVTFDFAIARLPATTGVPEPAVAYTVGLGLFAVSALRLRKRAR
jgi:hypothetical protein